MTKDTEILYLTDKLEQAKKALAIWQRYASYLYSCALSGEHDPQIFELFHSHEQAKEAHLKLLTDPR